MYFLVVWLIISVVCTGFVLACIRFAPTIDEESGGTEPDSNEESDIAEPEQMAPSSTRPSKPTKSGERLFPPSPNLGGFGEIRPQEPRS